ncbi:L-alanine exporter AlaE [Rhodobacteraceae bacterium THAF1]|uniref:L-alanine exporter AlaE n=1 Tax=Palleronia sp. THAF1 TaxID=2587842 RepID=UPI000F3CF4D2|nr:L-alanine exporter AlaE [Palleronia sp. THAF1]QFU08247.1 L-alanine exporter AlaE [Palleronia sp. THAF1]VDC28803.1 L-alanine exporter AlaE [Rhodobacteraceae bacterium THAF1]
MRAFIVDTVATIAFFTVLAAATELFVAGMSPTQVLTARLVMVPIMVLTARPYGLWRDWLIARIKPHSPAARLITDTIGFLSFQVPIYAATLLLSGASVRQIALALGSATFLMAVTGRPFGLFLDKVRRMADTAPTHA